MHHVALQQAETARARFMVQISVYDPLMLVWLDEIAATQSGSMDTACEVLIASSLSEVESAINYRPPSIIGRARALTLAATNKLVIAKIGG